MSCRTVTPNIKCCARLIDATGSKKTPKYKITHKMGYFPELENLKGKDGEISFYLLESRSSGSKEDAPEMRLQGKNSLNITGLKYLFVDRGKLSGFAYGYPSDKKTYSKDNKPNPFYGCRQDAFLFVLHQKDGEPRPSVIDMLVLENGKALAPSFCKSLMNHGFDEALRLLDEVAQE